MDLYNSPPPDRYILGLSKWFQMPTDNGKTIPALAVTRHQGTLWNSAYTILITLIFVAVGNILVSWVSSWFPVRNNGNRHAILVAFLNTGDPISALLVLFIYLWRLLFHIETERPIPKWFPFLRDWTTLGLTFILWLVHAGIFGTSTAAGIVIPGELMMGTMARVNPNAIFYPAVLNSKSEPKQTEAWNRLARVAAFRAVGFSEAILGEKVTFGDNPVRVINGRVEISFDYAYNLTGYDFGLQRAPGLRQEVSGHCQTEYSWIQDTSNATHDIYSLWGNKSPSNQRAIPIVGNITYPPPRAMFEVPSAANNVSIWSTGTVKFSILPNTAGRRSRVHFDPMQHPWYATEKFNDSVTNTDYVVMARRPAISCSQNTTWHYRTATINSSMDFSPLVAAGLKVAPFWLKTVFAREFSTVPPIVTMSRNLGWANLPNFAEGFQMYNRIENSGADLIDDLKYLVTGSFVYSRELIRNTALLSPNRQGLVNAAEVNGVVPDETADFVLESSDIQTMSLRVLISIPAIFLALWAFALCEKHVLAWVSDVRSEGNGGAAFIARSIGFSAVQLYRYLDEELSGLRRWEGRLSSAPYIRKVNSEEILHQKRDRDNQDIEHQRLSESARKQRIPVSAQFSDFPGCKLSSTETTIEEDTDLWISKYATPRLMPLFKYSESSQSSKETDYPNPKGPLITEKEVLLTPTSEPSSPIFSTMTRAPETRRPIKVFDQYELAMVTWWDRKLNGKEGQKIWNAVQKGVEVNHDQSGTESSAEHGIPTISK
ncbi:hypothetical protein K440DRAFT_635940 [Wilcoxina mikolae CBS 423.85]|nr:hypothetical protein K440DRAFT_635940 [Wilcoxina mikolae CBS 423.85]